jgi:hypothetical protein
MKPNDYLALFVPIASQEHVDLRLTDISVQVDALRAQLEQMQRILKEVE